MYNSESAPASSSSLLDESPLAQLDPEIFAAIEKQLSSIRTNSNPQLIEIVQKWVQSSQNTITNAYQRAFVPKQ